MLPGSSALALAGCNSTSESSSTGGNQQDNDQTDDVDEDNDDTGDQDDDSTDPGDDGTTDPEAFTIGGEVIGLSSGQAMLQLRTPGNIDLDYVVTESGTFTFSSPLSSYSDVSEGDTYTIDLLSSPVGFQCSLINESGIVANTDITDVELFCIPDINARAINRSEFVELNWVNLEDYADLTTELCVSEKALSDGFSSCMAVGGTVEQNPSSTYIIDPATNKANYWFELAVQSGAHVLSRTVTARPEDPAAPTSQEYTQIPTSGSQIVVWGGTAISLARTQVVFNNGTKFGGWTIDVPDNLTIESDYLEVAEDGVYFVALPQAQGFGLPTPPRELWRTDGTVEGTLKLTDRSQTEGSGNQFRSLAASGDLVAFTTSDNLYVIDESQVNNIQHISDVSASNLDASFDSANSIPMIAVDDGILFTGYLAGETNDKSRLLKLKPDLSVSEVPGTHHYDRRIDYLQARNGKQYFSAQIEVIDPAATVNATTLWRIADGEVSALFDPNIPANGGDGFRGVLSPIVTQNDTVYFYTQPWDADAGAFSEGWRLAYFNGVDTKLVWDESLLGSGWAGAAAVSRQNRVSAAFGNKLLFLAVIQTAADTSRSRTWVIYDPANDSFEHLSVDEELRFGQRPGTQLNYVLAEEKASGTWLVDGYSGNTASDSRPYSLIHLSVDGTNDFVIGTGSRIFRSEGERLWFQGGRVLAGD